MPRNLNKRELENVISQMVEDATSSPDILIASERGIIEVGEEIRQDVFRAFEKADESMMLAVDGGSAAILNAGSFVVAGVRVGQALYQGRDFVKTSEPEMHPLYISAGDLESAYSIFYGKTVGGEPPDTPRGLEETVGRIRALLEWKRVEDLLASDIEPGTVLSFDGALWAGIKGIGGMLARIKETASRKGVILCGISKKSMLTLRSRPLIPAVQMAGEELLPGKTWHYPVEANGYSEKLYGQIHIAKLHHGSRFAFRVDLSLPGGVTAEEALGKLAYYANDPTYAGYPYPLARAHNDVAFSRSEVEDLRAMLRSEALRKGIDPKEWHLTFQNFHDVLDTSR